MRLNITFSIQQTSISKLKRTFYLHQRGIIKLAQLVLGACLVMCFKRVWKMRYIASPRLNFHSKVFWDFFFLAYSALFKEQAHHACFIPRAILNGLLKMSAISSP